MLEPHEVPGLRVMQSLLTWSPSPQISAEASRVREAAPQQGATVAATAGLFCLFVCLSMWRPLKTRGRGRVRAGIKHLGF